MRGCDICDAIFSIVYHKHSVCAFACIGGAFKWFQSRRELGIHAATGEQVPANNSARYAKLVEAVSNLLRHMKVAEMKTYRCRHVVHVEMA